MAFTYDIIQNVRRKNYRKQVAGEAVEIEGITFGMRWNDCNQEWEITELRTGRLLAESSDRDRAIQYAVDGIQRLNRNHGGLDAFLANYWDQVPVNELPELEEKADGNEA